MDPSITQIEIVGKYRHNETSKLALKTETKEIDYIPKLERQHTIFLNKFLEKCLTQN